MGILILVQTLLLAITVELDPECSIFLEVPFTTAADDKFCDIF